MEGISVIVGLISLVIIVILLIYLTLGHGSGDPLKAIPGPKPMPILGNIFEMIQGEAVDLFLQWTSTYGKILKYKVFLLGTHVMVADAEMLKHILITNSHNYKKPESLLRPIRKIFGERCVICLSPDKHAIRRKILNPAFNTSAVKFKVNRMAFHTQRMVNLWCSEGTTPIQHDLTRLSLDILGDSVFGYNFNCLEKPNTKLTAALYRVMSVQDVNFMRFLPFYNYLPSRMNRDIQLIRKFVAELIKDKERSNNSSTMLDLMLQSRGINSDLESGPTVTNDDITDDVILFLIAGHETVTNCLCWLIFQLATNSEMQEKCKQEVMQMVDGKSEFTYEMCSELVYLECCIKEALRLHPPVPLTARQTIRDDTIAGYFIPAGTVIALQLGAMMRHPDYYRDPASFKPERFLNSTPRHTFLPFLAGPDMCIGNKLAMLEMKTIMAIILQTTKFTLTKGAEYKGCQGLTYHMSPPLKVHIEKTES